jgi:hypothetical protein
LEAVRIAELDDESIRLLRPYAEEMRDLVRAKKVQLQSEREDPKAEWHECQVDDKKVYINIT